MGHPAVVVVQSTADFSTSLRFVEMTKLWRCKRKHLTHHDGAVMNGVSLLVDEKKPDLSVVTIPFGSTKPLFCISIQIY